MSAAPPRRRLPAEWEPQALIQLTWPPPDGDWGELRGAAEAALLELARAVVARQPLLVVTPDEPTGEWLRGAVSEAIGPDGRCTTCVLPANDIWARDHAPLTVMTPQGPMALDWRFNGWAGRHPAERDDAIGRGLEAAAALPVQTLKRLDVVLEGGAIDSDGAGSLLTTRRCLLHPGRNPGMSESDWEELLRREMGIRRVLWLDHGALDGDDTDGHVDMLARFTDPDTIVWQACDDPSDPHHTECAALGEELAGMRRADGAPYQRVALPWPGRIVADDGHRCPATYANFLIINGAVLVPAYGVANDGVARQRLQALFPEREVVSIDARALITHGGALHCAAMQYPAPATA